MSKLPEYSEPGLRLAAFRRSTWFNGLPEDFQHWLADSARPLRLEAGQRLYGRGDAPDGMYFVVHGAIRIWSSNAEGREALLAFAETPQWFSESGLIDPGPHTHDAWAESDALLLHLGQHAMLEFLERHPVHWRALGRLVALKLKLALIGIETTAMLPIPVRLARRLVAIATGYGDWNGRNKRFIELQQDQLAAMVALSRQTVNQVLKDFEVQGVLRRTRGVIEIVNFELLLLIAELGERGEAG